MDMKDKPAQALAEPNKRAANNMPASLGRIVHFKVDEATRSLLRGMQANTDMEVLPAMIVRVWGADTVNLKVITDGERDLWVTSATRGDEKRQWQYPVY